MALKIWQDQLELREQNYMAKLRDEAMAEGKAKGKAEGKAEGRAEGEQKSREDALRFMVNDPTISDSSIANYLGIPVSEVPSIREKYKNK